MTRQQESARASSGLLRPATVRGDIRGMQRAIADGEDLDGVDEDGWTVRARAACNPQTTSARTRDCPACPLRSHALPLMRTVASRDIVSTSALRKTGPGLCRQPRAAAGRAAAARERR